MVGNPEGFDGNKTDLALASDSEEPTVQPVDSAEELRLRRVAQLDAKDTDPASPAEQKTYIELVAKVEAGDGEPLLPLTPQEHLRLGELDSKQTKSGERGGDMWDEDMIKEQEALRKRYLKAGATNDGLPLN